MARGWHYTKLSLPFFYLFLTCVLCYFSLLFVVFVCFVAIFCSRWSFVDIPLVFFCPADHVPDWQPRILLDMVEARSVNVKKTTTTTSRPPSDLPQLQALCGTEHRAFVPPIDLNHLDVVSLKRGRPIIHGVAKENRSRLALAVQHPARSLIIIVIVQFGVFGQPHRCILCVWFALIFFTFYLVYGF